MKLTHTTREWNTILISMMDDTHLLNTITMFLNSMHNDMVIIKSKTTNKEDDLDLLLSWYDIKDMKKNSKERIKKLNEKIMPYVFEAALRWINISTQLQSIFWRKWKKDSLAPLPNFTL